MPNPFTVPPEEKARRYRRKLEDVRDAGLKFIEWVAKDDLLAIVIEDTCQADYNRLRNEIELLRIQLACEAGFKELEQEWERRGESMLLDGEEC